MLANFLGVLGFKMQHFLLGMIINCKIRHLCLIKEFNRMSEYKILVKNFTIVELIHKTHIKIQNM
jgi:hypothetical protein